MKIRTVFTVATALLSSVLAGTASSAPKYSIIDVGPALSLVGFNNRGEILGNDASYSAFTFKHGVRTKLVIPSAVMSNCIAGYWPFAPQLPSAYAGSINDDGDIALTISDFPVPPETLYCEVLYRHGTYTIVDNSILNVYEVTGIDGADEIIYNTYTPDVAVNEGHGASCTVQDNPKDLDYFVQYNGINNRGVIVGASFAFLGGAINNPGAVVCRNGTAHYYKSPGGSSSQASAINNFGHATGYVTTETDITHAAVFDEDKTVDISVTPLPPAHDSYGTSINDFDEVVGMAMFARAGGLEPFLYYRHKLYQLKTLIDEHDPLRPYIQLQPYGTTALINNSGDIAVTGSDSRTNVDHIYILHPHDCDYRDHDE